MSWTTQDARHRDEISRPLLWAISGNGVTPRHVRSSLKGDIRQRERQPTVDILKLRPPGMRREGPAGWRLVCSGRPTGYSAP
jgi:hypothetical protein